VSSKFGVYAVWSSLFLTIRTHSLDAQVVYPMRNGEEKPVCMLNNCETELVFTVESYSNMQL